MYGRYRNITPRHHPTSTPPTNQHPERRTQPFARGSRTATLGLVSIPKDASLRQLDRRQQTSERLVTAPEGARTRQKLAEHWRAPGQILRSYIGGGSRSPKWRCPCLATSQWQPQTRRGGRLCDRNTRKATTVTLKSDRPGWQDGEKPSDVSSIDAPKSWSAGLYIPRKPIPIPGCGYKRHLQSVSP